MCEAHKYHSPRPQILDKHHVIPVSWGGPDVVSNIVSVCHTGHQNIHFLLDMYLSYHRTPPWYQLRSWGPGERSLAARAWAAYLANPEHIHPVRTS